MSYVIVIEEDKMRVIQEKEMLEDYMNTYRLPQLLPASVLPMVQLYLFEKGEYLCREGEQLSAVYLLVQGKCKVTKCMGNGKEFLVCFCDTFTLFGEVELLTGKDAQSNVQVTDSCYCIAIPFSGTKESLMNSTAFLKFICTYVCEKMTRSNKNASINLNYTVEQRISSYIISTEKGLCFRDNYTHLAEYLGCSHRQLLRALRSLCDGGILEREKGSYQILDIGRLTELAGDVYQM